MDDTPSPPSPVATAQEALEAEAQFEASLPAQSWPMRRLDYSLLALVAILTSALAFAFFFFDIDLARLSAYGYIGLFFIALISAASIVLPMPGAAAITGAGAFLDPVIGIPAPILIGLVAGPAEAIGEMTGYAAGYGGNVLFRERPFYPRVKAWMQQRGILTMFLLSSVPNPLVDVAGVAAGAVRMKLRHFFVGVLFGKIVKNIYLSTGGLVAADLIRQVLE